MTEMGKDCFVQASNFSEILHYCCKLEDYKSSLIIRFMLFGLVPKIDTVEEMVQQLKVFVALVLSEYLYLVPSTYIRSKNIPTPVPSYLMPSSGLCWQCTHFGAPVYMHANHLYT